jgi:hypothetical protein
MWSKNRFSADGGGAAGAFTSSWTGPLARLVVYTCACRKRFPFCVRPTLRHQALRSWRTGSTVICTSAKAAAEMYWQEKAAGR